MCSDLWVFWDELRSILREIFEMSSDFERIFWLCEQFLSVECEQKWVFLFVFKFWTLFQWLEIFRYLLSKVVIGCVEKCLNLEVKLAPSVKTSPPNFNRLFRGLYRFILRILMTFGIKLIKLTHAPQFLVMVLVLFSQPLRKVGWNKSSLL